MTPQPSTANWKLETVTRQLLDYCQKNKFSGHDPYDALNSELFKRLPFLDFWLPRLALTQILKRSPINFRPLLMIPKTQNPKALAVFLMAFLKLEKVGLLEDKSLIPLIAQKLIGLRSPDLSLASNVGVSTVNRQLKTDNGSLSVNREPSTVNRYYCWGYSFPWQGRSVLAPRGAPNLVCTVFVANALLDLYEHDKLLPVSSFQLPEDKWSLLESALTDNRQPITGNDSSHSTDNNADLLFMATSAADYLLNELYWSEGDNAGFSYPLPSFKTRVHNANFLAAALFCRIYKHTGEKKYLEPALKAARYSTSMQHPDGSWYYGEHEKSKWVDNFHTGYNLGGLRLICDYLNTDEFEPHIHRGFNFYRDHFFREDGAPKYFHNKTFPIDIHSAAQSIITLIEFRDLHQSSVELANRVFEWTMANMWDNRGYFYYQITPYYKNKISYMRWSQSWMLLSLATLLEAKNG